MNFIDLTGRQDEPAVRSVLELSHGSARALHEACDHYRSGAWTFIGWQERKEVLACAGAEWLGYRMRLASCARDFTSSFRNTFRRWYSTVLGLMNS
jgi:hypothetical protein